jgi:hypothetical protein
MVSNITITVSQLVMLFWDSLGDPAWARQASLTNTLVAHQTGFLHEIYSPLLYVLYGL